MMKFILLLLALVAAVCVAAEEKVVKDEEYWKNHRRHLQEHEGHDLLLDEDSSPRYGGTGLKCENRWGNPCGPDGLCKNTPTGYTCTPVDGVFNDCATGCGPNTYCEQVSPIRKMCLCVDGFYRPDPHLPCIEDTEGVRRRNRKE